MIPHAFSCPRLDSFQVTVSPDGLSDGALLPFKQAWREAPEADFMPGLVKMGWAPEGFMIWAELQDRDIFNPVTIFNEPAFLKGDVFEIFMRPEASDTYYEFHVTPHNQLFQYRIPSAAAFRALRTNGICQEWLISSPVVESRTEIHQKEEVWQVWVKIPVEKLGLPALKTNDRWHFSFCRYDYSQDRVKPTLSSASPLEKIDFHDQSCWLGVTLM